jgi:hypothetical protein
VTIYALAPPDRSNTFFPLREALALPNLASVNGTLFRRARHGSGRTMAIEYVSMQILRKPAQSFVQTYI